MQSTRFAKPYSSVPNVLEPHHASRITPAKSADNVRFAMLLMSLDSIHRGDNTFVHSHWISMTFGFGDTHEFCEAVFFGMSAIDLHTVGFDLHFALRIKIRRW